MAPGLGELLLLCRSRRVSRGAGCCFSHRTCWASGGSACCIRVFPKRSRSSRPLLVGGDAWAGGRLSMQGAWAGGGTEGSVPSDDWKPFHPTLSELGAEGGVGSLRPKDMSSSSSKDTEALSCSGLFWLPGRVGVAGYVVPEEGRSRPERSSRAEVLPEWKRVGQVLGATQSSRGEHSNPRPFFFTGLLAPSSHSSLPSPVFSICHLCSESTSFA